MNSFNIVYDSLPLIALFALVGAGATLFVLPGLLPESMFKRGILSAFLSGVAITVIAVLSHAVLQSVRWLTSSLEAPLWIGPPLLFLLYAGTLFLLPEKIRIRLFPSDDWQTGTGRFILAGAIAMYPFWNLPAIAGSFAPSMVYVTAAGLGLSVLFSVLEAMRIRLETSTVPDVLKGMPSLLLAAGLAALVLLGGISCFP